MAIKVYQVDAFADRPFAGNPAAVCLLDGPAADGWMQAVAGEMNLSETAFLYSREGGYSLRWFTPATEVKLCGHATLASAHVLYESGQVDRAEEICFFTASGPLRACWAAGQITIDLPAEPPQAAGLLAGLAEALGVRALFAGRNRLDYLAEVDSEEAVRALRPDFARLILAAPDGGVIVTSRSVRPEYDYVCRYFDPAEGIDEDPVTGSAHCCLGPYWQAILGKAELSAYQASPRGGALQIRVAGERVFLSGQAVTVLRGEFLP